MRRLPARCAKNRATSARTPADVPLRDQNVASAKLGPEEPPRRALFAAALAVARRYTLSRTPFAHPTRRAILVSLSRFSPTLPRT
jgi:hypothetical protein